MSDAGRPGPKPKRLYVRVVRWGPTVEEERPGKRQVRPFLENLERVGRLVAHGELTEPAGDLLIVRAQDLAEATRILRADPFRGGNGQSYELYAWNPLDTGAGVNLEPPPARGSGRLTLLQRVAVFVKDQQRAVDWYRDVLGLTVRTEDSETGYVELALGRGAAAVSLIAPRPEWGEPYYSEARARIGSRTGIAFQTDSVAALELRLQHAGATVTQSAETQPWGGISLRFTDPDGNEFLAFQPKESPKRAATGSPEAAPEKD